MLLVQFLQYVFYEPYANFLYALYTWTTYKNAKRVQYKSQHTAQNPTMQYA